MTINQMSKKELMNESVRLRIRYVKHILTASEKVRWTKVDTRLAKILA
jgi:hypothetical protein